MISDYIEKICSPKGTLLEEGGSPIKLKQSFGGGRPVVHPEALIVPLSFEGRPRAMGECFHTLSANVIFLSVSTSFGGSDTQNFKLEQSSLCVFISAQ